MIIVDRKRLSWNITFRACFNFYYRIYWEKLQRTIFKCVITRTYRNYLNEDFEFCKKNVSNSVGFVLFYFEYFFELASNHHSKHDLFQKDKASGGSDASLRCAFFEKKKNFSLNLILSKATSD